MAEKWEIQSMNNTEQSSHASQQRSNVKQQPHTRDIVCFCNGKLKHRKRGTSTVCRKAETNIQQAKQAVKLLENEGDMEKEVLEKTHINEFFSIEIDKSVLKCVNVVEISKSMKKVVVD
ncbi:hypothetical protein TSAR_008230 [Trichomalopsis sarcophagae]|uniref:Uncharacterized protein n=1 Tax=Trichomalopsis sarcophagae TaxID=543379 RepID=A0A232FMP7_9HYME|nr:hypothetical protein TSAR_008230 [Trichomalopsis sarcophagae]